MKNLIKSVSFKTILILLLFVILLIGLVYSKAIDNTNNTTNYPDSNYFNDVVYFDFNSSNLKPESFKYLDSLSELLLKDNNSSLEIIGHADNIGSFNYNMNLSKLRALEVINYLVSKGCKPEMFIPVGLGFSAPVSNDKAKNRRVEFHWIKQPFFIIKKYDANGNLKTDERNNISAEFTVADSEGVPYTELKEENVSAVLKWEINQNKDSLNGKVNLYPIDERKKIAVSLIMDYSGSMYDSADNIEAKKTAKIIGMENGVMEFINNMNPNIYAKIIKFGASVELVQKFTNDVNVLRNAALDKSYNRNSTALFKAMHMALVDTTFSYDPTFMKSFIAFTDGDDNTSGRITIDSVIIYANKIGVRIYTIGLFHPALHTDPPGFLSYGEKSLFKIAQLSGGFYNYAMNSSSLADIYKTIINQIKNSYSVSIYWTEDKLPPPGTKVKAVVRLNVKGQIRTIQKDYVLK